MNRTRESLPRRMILVCRKAFICREMFKNAIAAVIAAHMCGGASMAATLAVKPGESIQAAVARAAAGDRIEVYPGTYHETVYIDRDGINLQGIVEAGKWPVLDGESSLNDGILVSGHG